MRIRPASAADKPALADMHKASIRTMCSGRYSPDQLASWLALLTPLAYDHALRSKVFLVAEEDSRILGLGILALEASEISAVYVDPDAAGRGVGSSLLLEMERVALAHGVKEMKVQSTLNAEGFYDRHGYGRLGPSCFEPPGGLRLECVRMAKHLGRQEGDSHISARSADASAPASFSRTPDEAS